MATVCAIECGSDAVIFVCCDLVGISDDIRDGVRSRLAQANPGFDPAKVIFNATHTHTAPEVRKSSPLSSPSGKVGVELGTQPIETYINWLVATLTDAIVAAWNARAEGAFTYGLGYAVLGRNRRWVDANGKATMYGLIPAKYASFRHIEGYEDHSLNLMATYDGSGELTGLIVNIPCTAQEGEHGFQIAADFWHEARALLRQRFGAGIFILPQVSAAGDLTSHLIWGKEAHERMLKLRGQTAFEFIAEQIADAIGDILPYIKGDVHRESILVHHSAIVDLPANKLTQSDVDNALADAEKWRASYEEELAKLEADPSIKTKNPRWYVAATQAYRRMQWLLRVKDRFEQQNADSTLPAEIHVVRLGDIAFATNPYELYLDFGIRIKVLSPAVQTFLVQLSGSGTYVPSHRSVLGGGYGSVPSSNPVGPNGGDRIVEYTTEQLTRLFPANNR